MVLRLSLALTAALSAPAYAGGGTVVVTNQSSFDIDELYLSPSASPSWEDDKLGDLTLTRGNTFALTGLACDVYDARVIDEDGDTCEIKAVRLCGETQTWVIDDDALIGCQQKTQAASARGPGLASLTLVNRSDWTLTELYLSATSRSSWGPDQLGEGVVGAGGGSVALNGIACDSYDVRLVDEDGDECLLSDVALCGGREQWVITSEDLLACQNMSQ